MTINLLVKLGKVTLLNIYPASEGGGFTCFYLRCSRWEGALSWRRADVEAGREKLSCLNPSCGASIQDSEVILTRDRIAYQGYDILFNPNQFLQHNQNFLCYLMLLSHVYIIMTKSLKQTYPSLRKDKFVWLIKLSYLKKVYHLG
ncbi:hypothetical protein SD81_033015 [Tolypothrix campylonemoides VB511288]|nr:hypothetical protein SD81_033015 [Tolypothrix campylonemoides VB511288]